MSKMSRKSSKQVSFSPDDNHEDNPTIFLKQGGGGIKVSEKRKTKVARLWSLRLSEGSGFSPLRFLSRLEAKMARALRFVSIRKRPSPKVCSSSLARSWSYAETIDSHQAEAIEDCIEFLNSSSSLHRSSSVSAANSCFN